MKKGIHPEYQTVTVTCNCGYSFQSCSTKDEIHIEICCKCHPFYTGKQKFVDSEGRIDRFNKRFGLSNLNDENES